MAGNNLIGRGVVIKVTIETLGGDSVVLWNQMEDNTLDPPLKDLPVVSGVEIKVMRNRWASFTVNLDMTYEQGMAFINSPLVAPGNMVSVQLSYPDVDASTPIYYGLSLMPSASVSPEGVTVELMVAGPSRTAANRSVVRQWPAGTTVNTVLTDIAKNYFQRQIKWQPSELGGKLSSAKIEKPVEQVFRSDWFFFLYICRLNNLDAWEEDDKGSVVIVVSDQKSLKWKQPEKKFVMRGNINPAEAIYPLLTFEPQGDWLFMAASARGILGRDINPDDKTLPDKKMVDNRDPANTEGLAGIPAVGGGDAVLSGKPEKKKAYSKGAIPEPGYDDEGKMAGKHVAVSSRDQFGEQKKETLAREGAAQNATLISQCTSLGIASLKPGEVIEVIVTGDKQGLFDGNYIVNQVTHSAGGDGWNMNFEVHREAFWVKMMELANKTKEKVNDKESSGKLPGLDIEGREMNIGSA